jgi:transcriptional regulator with XRE-family HTH domain
MEQDYNHIPQWLKPKLKEKQLSVERFARSIGLTRAAVYNYLNDEDRPSEQVMKRMCDVLGRPFEEGLKQYVPKKEGRRPGYTRSPAELSVKRKK